MALTLVRSSALSSAANNIVSINSRSQGSSVKVIDQYRQFSRFLEAKTLEIERVELPNAKDIKGLSKINVANTFGSAGGLLGGLLGGALDIGGFIRGIFTGKGGKIGKPQRVQNPRLAPKPTLKGQRLRLGGIRALGVTNALFAGLDFATGLAQGESIGKSAAGTAGSLAGSLLGGAIGQTLIPIPGVGFVIGSAVGGFLGGWSADRVYDTAAGMFSSPRQKQEQQLERGKRERPNVVQAANERRQNRILNKFDTSVSSFEGFIRGILDGKINLSSSAPMEEDVQQRTSQNGPESGQVLTTEGGEAPSKYFTSPYGASRSGHTHGGVDYAGPSNSPISVIVPGRVTFTGVAGGYGNTVIIEHPNGIESLYGHLSSINVRVGQQIAPGTVIGNQGYSGTVIPAGPGGEHVHFELRPKGGTGGSGIRIGNNEGDNYFRFGGNVRVTSAPAMEPPGTFSAPRTDLIPGATISTAFGRQASMAASNLPATNTSNIKGYIIVPGHITGGGTEGEISAVEKVAINVVNKLKAQFPGIPVILWNHRNYEQTDKGFEKEMNDLKRLEEQGWQVLELHFDAPGGTGRGLIAPYNRNQVNPLESILGSQYGLYPADWGEGGRGKPKLKGPRKGISLFEMGNMTPELRRAFSNNNQAAVDYFSRDIISAFIQLINSGQMPGVRPNRPTQVTPTPASYMAPPSRASNLNINTQLPYNQGSNQIIIIERPTIAMIPTGGSSGRPTMVPIPVGGGGGSVNVVVSDGGGVRNILNKIQEYRLT